MTLSTSLFEIRDTATTGNVNGAGFNPNNANFLTDLTTDTNTANTASPVISTASYNFVAGDVGAWIYIKSGTNWTPGFYQIASVASNKATLSAGVGAALQLNANTNMYIANTVAGIATVGTPTSGTFGVDYSQQNTAQTTATDFAAIGASTTLTSATAAFTRVMVGNYFHQTTTGTGAFGVVGWYEIVSYTNATTVVLDRTPNSGTASVACTGFVGGAGRLNALETSFCDMVPAGSTVYIKNGTYTASGAVNSTAAQGTAASPVLYKGYNSLRSDTPTVAQRPIIALGSNALTFGTYVIFMDANFTGTSSAQATISRAGCILVRCKIFNSSPSAGRIALTVTSVQALLIDTEIICQMGTAISGNSSSVARVAGCYVHDSVTGFTSTGTNQSFVNCLFEACSTAAVTVGGTPSNTVVDSCTFYGREGKAGIGLNVTGATTSGNVISNNIFYGLTTAVSITSGQAFSYDYANDFFNNTTNLSASFFLSPQDVFLTPQFTSVADLTGTTATTSGSILTDSSANFSSVVDNQDFVRVTAGTGTTLGNYLIVSHTTTTLTVNNALGTGGTADKVYVITTGHNYGIGTNLKALGDPGPVYGSSTTGYLDIGVAQRQESSGGGASSAFVG